MGEEADEPGWGLNGEITVFPTFPFCSPLHSRRLAFVCSFLKIGSSLHCTSGWS